MRLRGLNSLDQVISINTSWCICLRCTNKGCWLMTEEGNGIATGALGALIECECQGGDRVKTAAHLSVNPGSPP